MSNSSQWIKNPQIVKSWRKNKKYAVKSPSGFIHFGDKRYKDFTQHRDPDRRRSYLSRARAIRDKNGNLTYKNPYSPNYWAIKYLWKG